ncbi:MAG: class I mannose-6-phosphate isomerase [Bacteroidia bacterium]|nr:class I mannose-6-phosphate isomerase [Bacteroidia bacterium]
MSQIDLYPLKFEPIYQYRLWGGRRLAELLSAPLPGDGPIGEAWLLSDRDDQTSHVANGPLKGQTISQLMEQFPEQLLGKLAGRFHRFPLLLKFLDVSKMLSVQVHPKDDNTDLLPAGETGKTEAWVVLKAGKESRIYAGLKQGTNADNLQQALTKGTVADHLTYFTPELGDGIFIPAGTVHSLGNDVVVFEIQENSDVTFRLYDWNHVDAKTSKPRPLQVEQALSCINFKQGEVRPVAPVIEEVKPVLRERLFLCKHFGLWRLNGELPFNIGEKGKPRVIVCIDGDGQLESNNTKYEVNIGDVLLIPAMVGACIFQPHTSAIVLEISLPE